MILKLRRAALAVALTCFGANAFAAKIPTKVFAQLPQYGTMALSPNGKLLAITTPIENRTDLMIIDLSGKKDPKRVRYMPNEHVVSPFWADDERLVVSKAIKAGSLAQPRGKGELYSVDANGENQEMLFGYVPDQGNVRGRRKDRGFAGVLDRVPDSKGELIVYFSSFDAADRQSSIYRVNAHTGERKLIEQVPLRGANIAVDRNLRPRFASSTDDSNEPVLRYRATADAEWAPVPKTISGRTMTVLSFAKDNNIAWALISDSGEPDALYKVDFAKGSRQKIHGRDDQDIASVYYSGFDGDPFAVSFNAGKPAIQYLDPSSEWARLHAGLMKNFAGNMVSIAGFSRDSQTVLLVASSDRNPGTYYLLDRSTNKVSMLQSRFTDIDPQQMATMSPISFQASDGQQLNAFLTLPREGAKPFPVVVLPHGGPHGPYDSWGFDSDAQFLANRGYAVLQVNFRGSGGRGETFMKSGYRKWGTRIMDDIVDGLKFAAAQGLVDADRACIYGASFGGYASLMAPIRSPGTFKCAIGYLGVYDLNMLHSEGDTNDTKQGRNVVAQFVGEDKAELDANSPAKQGDKVGIPVLLVAGKEDIRAPMAHTDAMASALKKAGTPVEVMAKGGEAHGFYKEENRIELYDKMEAFLDKHIGAKSK
jgi:dipeptidyl aminopeptidase/acylaminoacyl peptidase